MPKNVDVILLTYFHYLMTNKSNLDFRLETVLFVNKLINYESNAFANDPYYLS